jgi:hypothetical protein
MAFSAPTGSSSPTSNISGYLTRSGGNYSPQLKQLFSQLLGGLQGGRGIGQGLNQLSGLAGGNEEAFNQLEAPTYTAFDKLLGQIGARFAGYGSGALNSSAFQNATSGAAGELAQNLGAQRMGIQQNALDRLLSLSDTLLSKAPKQKSGWDTVGDIGSLVSKILPFFL